MNRAKEAEEKRKEVSNKFQTTLTEIRVQMNDYHAMNDKLREENRKLSERLKSLMEHYEQREQVRECSMMPDSIRLLSVLFSKYIICINNIVHRLFSDPTDLTDNRNRVVSVIS